MEFMRMAYSFRTTFGGSGLYWTLEEGLMRIHRSLLAAVAAASIASPAFAAISYEPVVTMIGDGTAVVSGQGRTTTIQIYQASLPARAAPVSQSVFDSGASGTRLVNSDSATSEGMLSNNPGVADAAAAGTSYGGTVYTYSAGYDAPNQTTSINSTAANANRVVGYVNVTGGTANGNAIPFSQTQASAYDNNNFRSATGDDNALNVWSGGTGATAATAGRRYFNTNTQTTTTNSTNVRTTEIRNNTLFGTTGSSTHGLYAIGSPAPTTSGNTATNLINTGSSSSPYEFVLIDDPNNAANTSTTFGVDTAYIADDSSIASGGGIQKWTWDGTTWTKAYTLSDTLQGDRGLAGGARREHRAGHSLDEHRRRNEARPGDRHRRCGGVHRAGDRADEQCLPRRRVRRRRRRHPSRRASPYWASVLSSPGVIAAAKCKSFVNSRQVQPLPHPGEGCIYRVNARGPVLL